MVRIIPALRRLTWDMPIGSKSYQQKTAEYCGTAFIAYVSKSKKMLKVLAII